MNYRSRWLEKERDLVEFKKKVSELKMKLEAESEKMTNSDSIYSQLLQEKIDCEQNLNSLQQEMQQKERDMVKLREEFDMKSNELDEKEKAVIKRQKELDLAEKERMNDAEDVMADKQRDIKKKEEELNGKLAELDRRENEMKEQQQQLKQEQQQLKQEQQQLKQEQQQLKQEQQQLKQEQQKLKEQQQQLKKGHQQLEREREELDRKKQMVEQDKIELNKNVDLHGKREVDNDVEIQEHADNLDNISASRYRRGSDYDGRAIRAPSSRSHCVEPEDRGYGAVRGIYRDGRRGGDRDRYSPLSGRRNEGCYERRGDDRLRYRRDERRYDDRRDRSDRRGNRVSRHEVQRFLDQFRYIDI